jgi:hypothetical protein
MKTLHLHRSSSIAIVAGMLLAAPAYAEMSAEELAKLAQNPVGNLISLPFQNNTNLNFGPEKGTQNILNIQPVIPISVDKDWNIITRTILPVISMPALGPDIGSTNGIGDIVLTAFLSPANPGHWIWGAGPVVQIPTNSSAELGNKNWGLGPSVVVLHLDHGSPWVYGALVNNIWSLTSDKQGGSYNNGLIQPFVNYNFPDGFYLTSAPILTVDWKAESSQQWTVPIGGGVGKIFHLGKLPADRRRRGQDLPSRQAAGEHPDLRLLQRRAAGLRCQLADPRAGPVDVSEVTSTPSGIFIGVG